ncbi:MAG: sigma-70 family RNA polymerase sigma factor [Planctomycetes bacterium]|jgi:RNA polymerase sigma-70 factor (ECF subfamily)|nr:sigma-70 family RNA polymerase sigma factor [Planctomycetota bacterium]MCL4729302.1 sigma-70 family RNA polymerase sigma factor [Planctomycetota bacterium]
MAGTPDEPPLPGDSDTASASAVPALDTPALVAGAQNGDRQAFTELMRRYFDAVMRQIVLYVGADRASAEDVAQETWWRIARGIGGFSGRSGFYTWACRIARNEAHRRLRKYRALPVLPEPVQDSGAENDRNDRAELVHEALRRLPEKFRLPLVLELWEERSVREMADALGLPEGTVKSRLFRAREKFREVWLELTRGH